MRIKHQVVVFDAADVDAEAAFWAGVLDGEIDVDDGWRMVFADGEPRIGVQHAPDHVAPLWPTGEPSQQMHVDLWVDDFDEAHAQVMALGARVLKEVEPSDELDAFQVYADPAGHPFCLCWIKQR